MILLKNNDHQLSILSLEQSIENKINELRAREKDENRVHTALINWLNNEIQAIASSYSR